MQRAAQLVEAGLWLQMSGDVDGARRLFEQALKLDPANDRARSLLDTRQPAPAPVAPHVPPENPFQRPALAADGSVEMAPVDLSEAAAEEPPMELESPQAINFAPDATSAWDSQSNPGVHLSSVTPGMGDVMDMITATPREQPAAVPPPRGNKAPRTSRSSTREEVDTLLRGARDLLELDDHTGAMDLILKAQALAPNDREVQQLRTRSEKTLQAMFESKLGEMSARPRVILKQDEIIWLNLDHRAGFVLAQIDGTVSFEDLFEVCGMSRLDTARILAQLIDEGVISADG